MLTLQEKCLIPWQNCAQTMLTEARSMDTGVMRPYDVTASLALVKVKGVA